MAKEPTKTETPAPAPEPTPVFSHPGRKVWVLVPGDQLERDIVLKHLENELFPLVEVLPTVTSDLTLEKFRGGEVIYVAHPIDARVKDAHGRFTAGTTVHVSAPVDTFEAVVQDGEGFSSLDPQRVVGALSRAVKPSRAGRCYYLNVSEDLRCKVQNH
jgi:hypothetical protein